MSKSCYLIWEEGQMVCTTAHKNYVNCDLTAAALTQEAE